MPAGIVGESIQQTLQPTAITHRACVRRRQLSDSHHRIIARSTHPAPCGIGLRRTLSKSAPPRPLPPVEPLRYHLRRQKDLLQSPCAVSRRRFRAPRYHLRRAEPFGARPVAGGCPARRRPDSCGDSRANSPDRPWPTHGPSGATSLRSRGAASSSFAASRAVEPAGIPLEDRPFAKACADGTSGRNIDIGSASWVYPRSSKDNPRPRAALFRR